VSREEWVASVNETLQRAGHLRSSPRERVLRALAHADGPVSAQELEDQLRSANSVSRATIYHALELLDRHELVFRLDLGDGHARYLPADPTQTPPHFLLCQRCRSLFALPTVELDSAIQRDALRLGVAINPGPLVLHGLCAPCLAASPGA
jgi:Fe2+ or Zn2+ uptake regulation protein